MQNLEKGKLKKDQYLKGDWVMSELVSSKIITVA